MSFDPLHSPARLTAYDRYAMKMVALGLSPCMETVDEEGLVIANDGRRYSREEIRRLLAEDDEEEDEC